MLYKLISRFKSGHSCKYENVLGSLTLGPLCIWTLYAHTAELIPHVHIYTQSSLTIETKWNIMFPVVSDLFDTAD
jgi:hypothetical protein